MLQGLRKNAKIFIYIIAGAFILSMGIGSITSIFIKKPYVAKIAGKKIYYPEYSELMKTAYGNYVQGHPDEEITDQIVKRINDETWNSLVAQILYGNEIKRLHIKVTDQDVLEKLKNPPEDIKSIPQLQTDDQFDYNKYENILLGNQEFATYLEQRFRANLPYEKLFKAIKSEVLMTEEEVKQEYMDNNNKADAKIIYFDPKKIIEVEITDEEKQAYYEENKEEYKRDPACKYKYIKVLLKPSDEDNFRYKTRIDSIYNLVLEGMDFAKAAIQYSQGPSGPKGGDLGYFTKGRMVKEFEDAAFSLKKGEIAEPILTQFGWHIIKVYDIRKNAQGEDEIKASHILLKTEPSEVTINNLEIIALDVYEKVIEKGIEEAAEDFAYEVSETREFFENAKYISGLGQQEELVKFAFKNNVGQIHEPTKLNNGDFLIAEISSKVGEHYQELSEVESRIFRKIENKKKLEEVLVKAQEFETSYEPEQYFAKAKQENWDLIEASGITINKIIPKLRKDEILNQTILDTKENDLTKLIIGENGAYIALVAKRNEPDMEKFEQEKENLIAGAQIKAENDHLNQWFIDLKEAANIEDYRSIYFE